MFNTIKKSAAALAVASLISAPAREAANIPDKSDTYLGHVVVFISINFLNSCFKTALFR